MRSPRSRIVLYRIVSYRNVSYRVVSYRTVSYRLASAMMRPCEFVQRSISDTRPSIIDFDESGFSCNEIRNLRIELGNKQVFATSVPLEIERLSLQGGVDLCIERFKIHMYTVEIR